MSDYQACSNCILDNRDDSEIQFDQKGVCNHCHQYAENLEKYYRGHEPELKSFHALLEVVREKGKGQPYDAVIGLSGGVDSTYLALLCHRHGLRALAVHLDNGWNSELSVVNIKNILRVTGFDLHTHVINWREFRDLQRAYFQAHVVDIEALSDHAISAVMLQTAAKHNIGHILAGNSITTEGRLPSSWVHNKSDAINIKAIHKRFGSVELETFPMLGLYHRRTLMRTRAIRSVDLLDFIPYDKAEAKKQIIEAFGWRDYGGKHYESVFTRFYQAYILPKKFSIDKRKSHYSTLICAGQMSREEALIKIAEPTYASQRLEVADREFVLKKLGFTSAEFDAYLQAPAVAHRDYPSIQNHLAFLSRCKQRFLSVHQAVLGSSRNRERNSGVGTMQ